MYRKTLMIPKRGNLKNGMASNLRVITKLLSLNWFVQQEAPQARSIRTYFLKKFLNQICVYKYMYIYLLTCIFTI